MGRAMFQRRTLQRAVRLLSHNGRTKLDVLRNVSIAHDDNIVKSPYKDIAVPNLTIPEYLWQDMNKWADKTAVQCGLTGREYTYTQLYRLSHAFAANLRHKLRLQDGDGVAVMMPNLPEMPIAAIGIMQAGCVMTTVNPVYTAHEVKRQLLLSSAKIVVTTDIQVPVVKEALKLAELNLPIISVKTARGSTPEGTVLFSELAEDLHAPTDILKMVQRKSSDLAVLPYSSGTTGLPKGVELEHRHIVANFQQIDEEAIRCHGDNSGTSQDSVMAVLPFFHIYGMSVVMLHKLARGCKLVTVPSFQPNSFAEAVLRGRVSAMFAAPPLVLFMATSPLMTTKHFEHMQVMVSGAAPLPTADIQRLFEKSQREFDFVQGYGLTETSPVICLGRRKDKAYETIGYPLPNTDLKFVDSDGNSVGPEKPGELLVRGPQVMRGYRDNPKANAEVFIDGWFCTGDLASYNARGEVTIKGRLKELIKVKGYQVPPAELESLLREHPDVADAAVVGASHPTYGEVPRAYVVCKSSKKPDPKVLLDYVAERVAPYKKIVHMQFIDAIPKNTTGKIDRKTLEGMPLP